MRPSVFRSENKYSGDGSGEGVPSTGTTESEHARGFDRGNAGIRNPPTRDRRLRVERGSSQLIDR